MYLSELSQYRHAQKRFGGIYIAIIVMGDSYSVETEISEGTITKSLNFDTLKLARAFADDLEDELKGYGVSVYPNRFLWENAMLYANRQELAK